MTPDKFFQSQQTLNTDRLSLTSSFTKIHKLTHEVFINPYPSQQLLKFPKNKNVRKQTQMNTLIQSSFNPQKLCIKPFEKANKSTLNDIQEKKRIAKFGEYNPLSKSLDEKHPQPRTFTDIGISGNMKKTHYNLKYKPDPIIVGEPTSKISKSNLAVWTEPRRLRDNGQVAKQQLKWKVDPAIKRHFYGEKKDATKVVEPKRTITEHREEKPDFTKVLNYQRRK